MAEETRIKVDFEDATRNGQKRTLYTEQGTPTTRANFEQALLNYEQTGQAPKGFVIVDTGSLADHTRSFLGMLGQGITGTARDIGQSFAPTGFAAAGEHFGLVKPGTAESVERTGQTIGEGAGNIVASQVRTPEAATRTAALAGASALAPPVAVAGGLSKAAFAANALLGGTAAAIGGQAGRLLGGESLDLGQAGVDFLINGIGQAGFQGAAGYLINKYVPEKLQQKVAGDLIDVAKARYPQLANDPRILQYAGDNAKQFAELAKTVGSGLRGGFNDVVTTMGNEVKNILPRALTKGEQNTFRMHMRNIVEAGNNIIDAQGQQELKAAQQAYSQQLQNFSKFFLGTTDKQGNIVSPGALSYLKDTDPTMQRIKTVLSNNYLKLTDSAEGATLFSYFKQSGQTSGFNPATLRDTIMQQYSNRTSGAVNPLVEDTITALSQGHGFANLPRQTAPLNEFTSALAKPLIGNVPFLKDMLASQPRFSTPYFPWQQPDIAGRNIVNFGVNSVGAEAARRALGMEPHTAAPTPFQPLMGLQTSDVEMSTPMMRSVYKRR